MKFRMACCAVSVAIAGFVTAVVPMTAQAGDAANCVSSEEATAFRLRDLQSQFMVAALSCNQQAAYNNFVEHFRPTLASAGKDLSNYFHRTGGGEDALNRHLTELANAAGLARAERQDGYCSDTWTMFLLLEEEPDNLPAIAAKHVAPAVTRPVECRVKPGGDAGESVVPPDAIDKSPAARLGPVKAAAGRN